MSFPPDSCRRHKQPPSNTHAGEMVGGQKSRILKGAPEHHGQRDRVRGEQRRSGGRKT